MEKLKVLIVEDEAIIALGLKQYFLDQEYEVLPIAFDADAAIINAAKYDPDVIFMDIVLKGEKNGIDAAIEINSSKTTPIIFITGNSKLFLKQKSNINFTYRVLSKPPAGRQLFTAIKEVVNI